VWTTLDGLDAFGCRVSPGPRRATYEVSFQASVNEPGQLALTVNGIELPLHGGRAANRHVANRRRLVGADDCRRLGADG